MNINADRIEEIFQDLCDQLEKITIGQLKDRAYSIFEQRAANIMSQKKGE